MKIKLISIFFVIILLFGCFFVSASSHNLKNNKFVSNFSDIAELPIWSIGNFWVYDMHFDFVLSGVFGIDGLDPNDPDKGITNMRVEVVEIDEINDEYTLDINGDLVAEMEILGLGFGSYIADLTGEAHIEISTLAIKDFEFITSGDFQLLITRNCDVEVTMTFNPPFNFFDFPIDTGEDPWNADTFGILEGHINVEGLYETDFNAEGPFEDEMISFVKKEEITVPGGTFDCFHISGSTGPSHGGWSRLWYSPAVKYLARVDEKILDWEGVDATLDLTLQATNTHTSALMDVTIHRIKKLDEIDVLPEWPGADWAYRLSIDDGDKWIHETNEGYSDNEDDKTKDVNYQYNVYTTTPRITIKVWDMDFWSGDDLADVSSQEGGGVDNEIPDLDCAIFKCKYNIADNKMEDNDTVMIDGEYFITSGDYLPDGSVGDPPDENDAKVWFKISDSYDPPEKPNKPQGPKTGKPGVEYTYTTSQSNPNQNQLFYKWDWGDGSYSDWLGPFNADETINAKHAWASKGSYSIRVKAKDVLDVESSWSDPYGVNMPRYKQFNLPFYQFFERFQLLYTFFNNIFNL